MTARRACGAITKKELIAALDLLAQRGTFDERLHQWLEREDQYATWLYTWCHSTIKTEAKVAGFDESRLGELATYMFQRAATAAFVAKCAYDLRATQDLQELFDLPAVPSTSTKG